MTIPAHPPRLGHLNNHINLPINQDNEKLPIRTKQIVCLHYPHYLNCNNEQISEIKTLIFNIFRSVRQKMMLV
jgi:hypothetical protein